MKWILELIKKQYTITIKKMLKPVFNRKSQIICLEDFPADNKDRQARTVIIRDFVQHIERAIIHQVYLVFPSQSQFKNKRA